eukprot:3513006-Ditylum_brightwellii.AAC.1
MAGDPCSGGVITWGYTFYIDGTVLPRFYKPATLVWPVLTQSLEIQNHSGGNGEPGVERDLRTHIPNPKFAGQIIIVAVGCADTLVDIRTKFVSSE